MAFSPDGARILTANEGGTASLWDAASGKLIGSFGHLVRSRQCARSWRRVGRRGEFISVDGARVLTTNADHSAKLWDAASGKLLTSLAHQDEVLKRRLVRTVLGF